MAACPGGETMERFIVGAQKSTNQLKAELAKLLPAAGSAHAGTETSGRVVDALLSNITDSLSQAARVSAARRVGHSATARTKFYGRRRWQRRRQGEAVNGIRSYFKCGHNSSCPAKKQVQNSDADPSKVEVAYFETHTCGDDPSPLSLSSHNAPGAVIISGTQGSTARLVPVAMVPSDQHCIAGQLPPLMYPVPDLTTAGSNVPRTAGDIQGDAAVVPEAAVSSTRYDPVPDDMPFTPSMEDEQAELFIIPSPACSQSDLLPTEVAKHGVAHGDERSAISDFTVPEL
ncbi:hypothetical protein HU200_004010 [Digitaria exilis]|uniref:WRKY domain-containing protein n=1 Tax=Digitaria exilis TaxID=1010633 RepID=A0A835FVM0_9POAL|nr:hypothetical protein HU200_004010 [Digitaria exilis]